MSFLLDIGSLIVIGIVIAFLTKRSVHKLLKRSMLIAVVTALFWLVGILLYLDYLQVSWLGDAGKGRHFMWNSGVELISLKPPIDVSVTYTEPFCALNILAFLLFLTYPIFLYLGVGIGHKIFEGMKMG